VEFELLGSIRRRQTIARGNQIRELKRLRRVYGKGQWRKVKGSCRVRLSDGSVKDVELHWYEAAGVGRVELKIKSFLD